MKAQELIDWYKENRATMPMVPFDLEEYIKVTDMDAFYKKLDKDVASYPDIFGGRRLIHHLGQLHKHVTQA